MRPVLLVALQCRQLRSRPLLPPSMTVTVCFSYNQSAGDPKYKEKISECPGVQAWVRVHVGTCWGGGCPPALVQGCVHTQGHARVQGVRVSTRLGEDTHVCWHVGLHTHVCVQGICVHTGGCVGGTRVCNTAALGSPHSPGVHPGG